MICKAGFLGAPSKVLRVAGQGKSLEMQQGPLKWLVVCEVPQFGPVHRDADTC